MLDCQPLLAIFLILYSCTNAQPNSSPFSCRDEQNNPVDWYVRTTQNAFTLFRFIGYKLPHLPSSPWPTVANGSGYLYMDVNNKQWRLSNVSLADQNHALAYTMQQFYDQQNDPVRLFSIKLSLFYFSQSFIYSIMTNFPTEIGRIY